MDEKKIIYGIVLDIWNLIKKYGFEKLSYEQWGQFVADGKTLRKKYAAYGKDIDILFRDMFGVIQNYYERMKEE